MRKDFSSLESYHWFSYNIQFLFHLESPTHQLSQHQMSIYNSNLRLPPFLFSKNKAKKVRVSKRYEIAAYVIFIYVLEKRFSENKP